VATSGRRVVADFGTWGPVELKISIGEIANAVAIVATGFWVAHVIERRQASQRAIKNLIVVLCRECLDHLGSLSQIIESECPASQEVSVMARNKITRCLQRFSNSIHSIEVASSKAGLSKALSLDALKTHRESLRTQITDPLAQGPGLDPATIRQIEGTITQGREAVIDLEISLHQQ
jgi:hypothetical protein